MRNGSLSARVLVQVGSGLGRGTTVIRSLVLRPGAQR